MNNAAGGDLTPTIDFALPDSIRDGLLVHTAALSRKLDIMLLPRQVMLGGAEGEEPGDVSFVHGIPQASTLSGVTYAQDKRVRRALLAKAGLRVPEGASFSYRGLSDAEAFAKRVGFPLVLKEAVGESPTEEIAGIRTDEQLHEGVRKLRMLPGTRSSAASSMTRSAYALTGLLDMEEDEEGNKLSAPSTRFIIEQEVSGTCLRFLVLGDEVLAVLHLQAGLQNGLPIERQAGDIRLASISAPRRRLLRSPKSDDIHPGFAEIAKRAVRAVPGLGLAFVDIVADNRHLAPDVQPWWVVEVSERARLEVFSKAQEGLAEVLADRILRYEAERVSVPLGSPTERVTVAMRAESVPDVRAFVPLMERAAAQLGLSGHAEVGDAIDGTLDAVVQGRPADVAMLAEAIMGGGLGGSRAIVLTERHVDSGPLPPFSAQSV